jgi:hypothetical protein
MIYHYRAKFAPLARPLPPTAWAFSKYGGIFMVDYTEVVTEFRVGRVLSRSFSTLFRNIVPFGLLALVISAPPYVYTMLFNIPQSLDPESLQPAYSVTDVVITIMQFLLAYLLTAALVYGTIQDLRGRSVNVGECFSRGISMIFPVLGVAIVSFVLMALGFVALIIPGFIVVTMLWVAVPAAVIERNGLSALPRSAALTKGYRWRIFGLLLVLFFILFVLSLPIGAIGGVLVLMAMSGDGSVDVVITIIMALNWIVASFTGAFSAVVYAVSYHDLRVAKEGADTQQIASVFD